MVQVPVSAVFLGQTSPVFLAPRYLCCQHEDTKKPAPPTQEEGVAGVGSYRGEGTRAHALDSAQQPAAGPCSPGL